MIYTIDHCEPFDGKEENIWMKAEHIGRYLFAADYFAGKGGGKILDAACAEGFGSLLLERSGLDVCGMDINKEYLQTAKQRCKGVFAAVDFEKEEFPPEFNGFDGIVCFETIEHLDDGEILLTKLAASLKDGKHMLLSFPNAVYEKFHEDGTNYDPYHKRVYQKDEMAKLVKKTGFKIIDEYGQSLCNLLYGAERAAKKSNRLSQKEIDGLFRYDEKSLMQMTKLIGYPDKTDIDNSYSFLWILEKYR